MPQTSPQAAVLTELEPVVAENLDRHIRMAKEWHPHDYVPWDEGRNFAFLGGEDWSPEQSKLDETAKAAMFVNLLTEDNLPSYHREIATRFGKDGAWGQWVGRWTAEEGRHGVALRDYLVVTRGVDPVELERARMDYMTTGYDSGDKSPLEAVAYVSFQELATRGGGDGRPTGRGCVAERARPLGAGRRLALAARGHARRLPGPLGPAGPHRAPVGVLRLHRGRPRRAAARLRGARVQRPAARWR
jgi:acyl-[acyl-carrier-protein] desaturase